MGKQWYGLLRCPEWGLPPEDEGRPNILMFSCCLLHIVFLRQHLWPILRILQSSLAQSLNKKQPAMDPSQSNQIDQQQLHNSYPFAVDPAQMQSMAPYQPMYGFSAVLPSNTMFQGISMPMQNMYPYAQSGPNAFGPWFGNGPQSIPYGPGGMMPQYPVPPLNNFQGTYGPPPLPMPSQKRQQAKQQTWHKSCARGCAFCTRLKENGPRLREYEAQVGRARRATQTSAQQTAQPPAQQTAQTIQQAPAAPAAANVSQNSATSAPNALLPGPGNASQDQEEDQEEAQTTEDLSPSTATISQRSESWGQQSQPSPPTSLEGSGEAFNAHQFQESPAQGSTIDHDNRPINDAVGQIPGPATDPNDILHMSDEDFAKRQARYKERIADLEWQIEDLNREEYLLTERRELKWSGKAPKMNANLVRASLPAPYPPRRNNAGSDQRRLRYVAPRALGLFEDENAR